MEVSGPDFELMIDYQVPSVIAIACTLDRLRQIRAQAREGVNFILYKDSWSDNPEFLTQVDQSVILHRVANGPLAGVIVRAHCETPLADLSISFSLDIRVVEFSLPRFELDEIDATTVALIDWVTSLIVDISTDLGSRRMHCGFENFTAEEFNEMSPSEPSLSLLPQSRLAVHGLIRDAVKRERY